MSPCLLDVNVVIALLDPLHVHHDRAHNWFSSAGSRAWLSSPSTQNGVLRIVSHPKYPNHQPLPIVMTSLRSLMGAGNHRFVPDSISLVADSSGNTGMIADQDLTTSAQVTDTYLLALAVANRSRLATFDRRLKADAVPGGVAALLHLP